MRNFHCDHCGNLVFFENSRCEKCGHSLAYFPSLKALVSLDPTGNSDEFGPLYTTPYKDAVGRTLHLCANYANHDVCNWGVVSGIPSDLCLSCRLTRVIPDLKTDEDKARWYKLEVAKRRLVYSLIEFGLPPRTRVEDPDHGLAFELKANLPDGPRIVTGHENGIISLNIDEADDSERERKRVSLHEPYRTLLGHFRHEVGHYYWDRLVQNTPRLQDFRTLFGDEQADYSQALKTHYEQGPPPDWSLRFVSAYASSHPWEDWAETWAHYLHIADTLETAIACGLCLEPHRATDPELHRLPMKPASERTFDELINGWFPLTYVLNSLNRGMGLPDAYPFVLSIAAVEKLRFVHDTIKAGPHEAIAPAPVANPAPMQETTFIQETAQLVGAAQ